MATLEPLWLQLQATTRAPDRPSFFTSWTWIGTWLASLDRRTQPVLWQAQDVDGNVVGLAIVAVRRKWRLGIFPVLTGYLHETGLHDCDAITIEYNGVLAREDIGDAVTAAMVQAMMESGLDQLVLSGVRQAPSLESTFWHMNRVEHRAFTIDLEAIRSANTHYLGALDQRARYVVRKSIRRLSSQAPLRVEAAQTLAQARAFHSELVRLHNKYWNAQGVRGAFGTPFQQAFHARLLEASFQRGEFVVLALLHGEEPAGYMCFFCQNGWAHFYQSGIDYARYDSSSSPGLAAHALAAEFFLERGLSVYDFMAVDQQYKRTLSTQTHTLHWVTVSRRGLKLAAVVTLRAAARATRNAVRRFTKRNGHRTAESPGRNCSTGLGADASTGPRPPTRY